MYGSRREGINSEARSRNREKHKEEVNMGFELWGMNRSSPGSQKKRKGVMDMVCSRNKLSSVWLSSDVKREREKVESRGVKDGETVK